MLILLEEVLFGSLDIKQWHSFYLKRRVLQTHLDPVLKCVPSPNHLTGTANHGHQQCDQIAERGLTPFRRRPLKIFHLAIFICTQSNWDRMKVPLKIHYCSYLNPSFCPDPPLLTCEYRKYSKTKMIFLIQSELPLLSELLRQSLHFKDWSC